MSPFNSFQRISQAPTKPSPRLPRGSSMWRTCTRDPSRWERKARRKRGLSDEKLRQAYFWIVNHAIISPHYDIEYNDGPSQTYSVGDSRRTLNRRRRKAIPVLSCCRC